MNPIEQKKPYIEVPGTGSQNLSKSSATARAAEHPGKKRIDEILREKQSGLDAWRTLHGQGHCRRFSKEELDGTVASVAGFEMIDCDFSYYVEYAKNLEKQRKASKQAIEPPLTLDKDVVKKSEPKADDKLLRNESLKKPSSDDEQVARTSLLAKVPMRNERLEDVGILKSEEQSTITLSKLANESTSMPGGDKGKGTTESLQQ